MTQQEYEQKKRECWMDLALDAANMNKVTIEEYKRIFNGVFDKAYALGKQTETITQEEIEKAATKYACMTNGHPGYDPAIRKAYIEGVNFALGK